MTVYVKSALGETLDRIHKIHQSAVQMMALAETNPATTLPILADIPDVTWRAMMLTLRYPYDPHKVMNHI